MKRVSLILSMLVALTAFGCSSEYDHLMDRTFAEVSQQGGARDSVFAFVYRDNPDIVRRTMGVVMKVTMSGMSKSDLGKMRIRDLSSDEMCEMYGVSTEMTDDWLTNPMWLAVKRKCDKAYAKLTTSTES